MTSCVVALVLATLAGTAGAAGLGGDGECPTGSCEPGDGELVNMLQSRVPASQAHTRAAARGGAAAACAAAGGAAPLAAAAGTPTVTPQLVLTAKPATMEEMPEDAQSNVRRALEMNPELRLRWLGDAACRELIRSSFGPGLQAAFDGERRGSYRGDICRAAVLFREGGFYMDVDVQPRVPFSQMVDNTTTFMAAFDYEKNILNALLASEPCSEVMWAVLQRIEEWYANPHQTGLQVGWMGPKTMLRGVGDVVARECPSMGLSDHHQWSCGPHQVIRLYSEDKVECYGPRADEECPEPRRSSSFGGLHFGIFEPKTRRLVAWSRYSACRALGCGDGGWTESKPLAGKTS